jgi:hypothetical protein
MAEVGIALALEKKAEQPGPERLGWLNDALARYLSLVTGAGLRPGETADPFWVKEAALGAGRLAEQLRRWDVAASLYERLKELSPVLRDTWQARLERVSQLRQEPPPAQP